MRRWLTFYRDLGLQLLAFYLLLIIPFLVTLLIFDRLVGERIRGDVEANDIALARAIALETEIAISNSLKTVEALSSYSSVINVEEENMEEIYSIVLGIWPDVNLIYRLGADDYLTKPFGVGVLMGRIKAVLRCARWLEPSSNEEQLVRGDIRVDIEQHLVTVRGLPVD